MQSFLHTDLIGFSAPQAAAYFLDGQGWYPFTRRKTAYFGHVVRIKLGTNRNAANIWLKKRSITPFSDATESPNHYYSFTTKHSIRSPHHPQFSRPDPFPFQDRHSILPALVVRLVRALRPAHRMHHLLRSLHAMERTSCNFQEYRHACGNAGFKR